VIEPRPAITPEKVVELSIYCATDEDVAACPASAAELRVEGASARQIALGRCGRASRITIVGEVRTATVEEIEEQTARSLAEIRAMVGERAA